MSFVEFHQRADGSLLGLVAYEADPDWELNRPLKQDGLVHPLVHTDEGTGTWIAFDPERDLWGTVVRSPDAPFNDCLPPGEVPFLESFQEGDSLRSILERLRTNNEDAFANPFQAILGDRSSDRILEFHATFQSRTRTLTPRRYRLDDREEITTVDENRWAGFSRKPDSEETMEELLESISPRGIEDHRSTDGMRTLRNVLVFQWEDDLRIRTTDTIESSIDWKNPLAPAS